MKIGLFGGSFNPIHMGHLILIDQAMDQMKFDAMYIVPAACNPHKMSATDMASAEHRLAMTKIATAELRNKYPTLHVSDMEIKRGAPSYTVDTIRELQKESSNITLIIGEDSYGSLPYWKDIRELAGLVKFGIAERKFSVRCPSVDPDNGWQIHDVYGRIKTTSIDIPTFDTSGTEVRERIKEGRSVKYLIPDAVEEYIREHGLYVNKSDTKNDL